MSISKSTYLLLFLISEIFTQTVSQNTCAYTNSAIHPKQPSECLYQPAENGVCCYVTTTNNDEKWCLDLPMNKDIVDTTSYTDIKDYECITYSRKDISCELCKEKFPDYIIHNIDSYPAPIHAMPISKSWHKQSVLWRLHAQYLLL